MIQVKRTNLIIKTRIRVQIQIKSNQMKPQTLTKLYPSMAQDNRSPPSLPRDLIFYEIFARLPVKSIHRFRCVSTSCRRLPSDRQFLAAIRRFSAGLRYFASFPDANLLEGLALYSLDHSGAASSITVAEKTLVHANIVNGLMLTVEDNFSVTVSSADTNETFQLPPFPAIYAKHYRLFFYLCHDPEMVTYKVLRTAVLGSRDVENIDPATMKSSVFTLGAHSSSWRDYNHRRFKQSGDSRSVCIDGTLFLTRFCLDDISNAVICAFVVETEHFYAVGYPAGLARSRYYHCHPIELKGALAVIDIGEQKDLWKCEIKLWIKEKGRVEFGEHESWTEMRIGFDPRWGMSFRLLKSCSFSTNYEGEIVMGAMVWSSEDGCWIFFYNVDKGEWRRVEMQGVGGHKVVVTGDLRVEEYLKNFSSIADTNVNPVES